MWKEGFIETSFLLQSTPETEQLRWFGWQCRGLCGFSCFWDPTWARGGRSQAGDAGTHLRSPWWCWSAFPAKLLLFPQNQGDFWAGESRAVPCGGSLRVGEEEQFVCAGGGEKFPEFPRNSRANFPLPHKLLGSFSMGMVSQGGSILQGISLAPPAFPVHTGDPKTIRTP